jgi:transposase InsO family protein
MLFTAILWAYLLASLLNRAAPLWRGCRIGYRRLAADNAARAMHCVAKPAWVRKELVHLKALMPDAGCRAISDVFNRRFAAKRRMTVGKTFVSDVMRKHRYEIEVARRHIKNARPKPVPKNLIWALDLTGKGTLDGRTRLVLGILEHASRAALCLEALESKSSWTLISKLIEAIGRYGKPRAVRTDNEVVFTSRTFRFALTLLGVRHQRTDPGCPWQNGRAERFFGTLKEKLDRLAVDSLEGLNEALVEFASSITTSGHIRPLPALHRRKPGPARLPSLGSQRVNTGSRRGTDFSAAITGEGDA